MEKIKQFFNVTIQSEKGKDILIVVIVILVGLGSFELGRLSKENTSKGIKIEYSDQNTSQASANAISTISDFQRPNSDNFSGKTFFASRKGSKYYSLGCSAGKTIKQENRVYFTTGEEAEVAGYALSSSCR
ncbi:MAG: hypothetical protein WC694_01445 [Candidatus Paceibacterota bacterium]|jgi:hypothetical protein